MKFLTAVHRRSHSSAFRVRAYRPALASVTNSSIHYLITLTVCFHDYDFFQCAAHNFKRRDACFKCHASRQESEGGEGSAEVSMQPTPSE